MFTGKYSIKDLERLTGIKAHTIRIWEQRYGIVQPLRSNTGIREYDDNELKKILKISYLNKQGFKISKLAGLNETQLSDLIHDTDVTDNYSFALIDQLIASMMQLDEQSANKIINESIDDKGFEFTFEELFLPVLHQTGQLWQAGTIEPAREHFISGIIEHFLQVQIASTPKVLSKFRVILLQLPGDLHEISLMYIHYLLRKNGIPVLYLGVSVPPEDLKSIIGNRNDVKIYIHTVLNTNDLFVKNLEKLIEVAGQNKIYISGKAVHEIQNQSIIKIETLQHLKQLIQDNSI